jgi:hypothetical protein
LIDDGDRRLLRRLGYGSVPADLPGGDVAGDPRPPVEVLDRLLALSVVVAVARGLDVDAARRLLDAYDAAHALAPDEVEYLDDVAEGVRIEDAARGLAVEAVAMLAWALDLAEEPPLDDTAAVPAVRPPPAPSLRPVGELRRMLVLHEAMAWSLRADPGLSVGAAPGAVDPYVVHERHAALRWVLKIPPHA